MMRAQSSAPRVCVVSRSAPGQEILRHVAGGGAAAWIDPADGGAIVVRDAARTVARIATPLGAGPSGDRSGAEVALFAVAAAHGLGVGPDAIADALRASRARATRGAPAG
jgi:hypothetical protein